MGLKRIFHFRIPLALPSVIPPLAALLGARVPPGADMEMGAYELSGSGNYEIRWAKPFDYVPSVSKLILSWYEIDIFGFKIKLPMPVFVYRIDRYGMKMLSLANKAIITFVAVAPRREAVQSGIVMSLGGSGAEDVTHA